MMTDQMEILQFYGDGCQITTVSFSSNIVRIDIYIHYNSLVNIHSSPLLVILVLKMNSND